jgi:hypothetical protein
MGHAFERREAPLTLACPAAAGAAVDDCSLERFFWRGGMAQRDEDW